MLEIGLIMNKNLYLRNDNFVAIYSFQGQDVFVYLLKSSTFNNPKTIINQDKWFQSLNNIEDEELSLFEEFTYEQTKEVFSPQRSTLDFVFVEVNRNCNLGCIHCYVSDVKKSETLSINQFDKIIDKLTCRQPIDIRLIGGEPILNKDLVSICERCKDVVPRKNHVLLTNGTMDIDTLKKIINTGISLQISVYGMTFDTFHSFSNGSRMDFDNLFRNLQILSEEYQDKVKLVFIYSDITKMELDDFINFAQKNKFKYSYGGIMYIGRAQKNRQILGERFENISFHTHYGQRISNRICEFNRLCICANGDVTPCHYFQINDRDFVVGNIFNNSIDEILNGERFNKFSNLTVDDVEECQKCILRYLCSAGCCGETYNVTGSVLGKYTHCHVDECLEKIEDNRVYHVMKKSAGSFITEEIL